MKSSFKKPMKEIVDRVDLKDLGASSVLLDDREVRKLKAKGIGTREVIESCFYGYLFRSVMGKDLRRLDILRFILQSKCVNMNKLKEYLIDNNAVGSYDLDSEYFYGVTKNQLYRDIISALKDHVWDNRELIGALLEAGSVYHAPVIRKIDKALECKKSTDIDIIEKYMGTAMKLAEKRDGLNLAYLVLYIFYHDTEDKLDFPYWIFKDLCGSNYEPGGEWSGKRYDIVQKLNDKAPWTDDILQSNEYLKYVKKNIEGLVKYMKAECNETKEESTKRRIWLMDGACIENGVSMNLYPFKKDKNVTDEDSDVSNGLYLIHLYYESEFLYYWKDRVEDVEEISKCDITRYMPERDYAVDCERIYALRTYELFTDLYKDIIGEYVESVDIFKELGITPNDNNDNNEVTASNELKRELDRYKRLYEASEERAARLTNILRDKKDWHKERELEKIIEQKEEDIKELQDQISSQNEYISMLLSAEDEEKGNDCTMDTPDLEGADLELLRSKKYLFVCLYDPMVATLKKMFPDSRFASYNSKYTNLDVDGVVFITRSITHSIYYKVKNAIEGQNIKTLMYNNRSYDKLYLEMEECFFGLRKEEKVG